jgi:primosomal protein N' (replication factor Y)
MNQEFFHEGDLVSVQTAQPIDRMLDYKAPEGGHLGAFVKCRLAPQGAWRGLACGQGRL